MICLTVRLNWQLSKDQILANPLDKVDAPKPEDYETQFYTSDQIGVLLNLIKGDQIEIVGVSSRLSGAKT